MKVAFRSTVASLAIAASFLLGACQSQQKFNSPDEAVAALNDAVAAKDSKALKRMFGSRTNEIKSGDPEQDSADLTLFSRRLAEARKIQLDDADHATILVGQQQWPFAVPLVKENDAWRFDTDAGVEELANRRIGRNERLTIAACRTLIDAQAEDFERDPDGLGVPHHAQKVKSTDGRKDGLYWPTVGNEDPPPIGPVMADAAARRDERGDHIPYNGYSYRLITRQGAGAPGGAMDYLADGKLTRGWAGIAFPAEYGETGITSFLFGSSGKIYQKDLGEDSEDLATAITAFEPDSSWTAVEQ